MPTGTANVFNVEPVGRGGCNNFLSTTTCAGGTLIDLYYIDDGSGRQRWLFTPAPSQNLIPNGEYTIQSVGTAAEGNAACGTYFGGETCAAGPAVRALRCYTY